MKNCLNYYVCKSLGGIIYSDFFEIVKQGFGRFKRFYLVADTDGSLCKKGGHKKYLIVLVLRIFQQFYEVF